MVNLQEAMQLAMRARMLLGLVPEIMAALWSNVLTQEVRVVRKKGPGQQGEKRLNINKRVREGAFRGRGRRIRKTVTGEQSPKKSMASSTGAQ